MNNPTSISRRAALLGAAVSTAALAVPLVSRAADPTRPGASPVPAMAAAFAAARAELDAANAAYAAPFEVYCAENEIDPVWVDMPGFRFKMTKVQATRSSPATIEEQYANFYYLFSVKSGARMTADGLLQVTSQKELAAEQARDLAAALANWQGAWGVLKERATRCGLTAAEDRVDAACDALEAAWVALLSYVPRNTAEVQQKAAAVLAVAKAEPVQMDEDHIELFLRSLVGEVA